DRATAERHLNACEACRGQVQLWGNIGYVLGTLPAGRPSARVDQAIARLANPPRRVGRPALPGLAARAAIAGAAIVAVILGGLPLAQQPGVAPGCCASGRPPRITATIAAPAMAARAAKPGSAGRPTRRGGFARRAMAWSTRADGLPAGSVPRT